MKSYTLLFIPVIIFSCSAPVEKEERVLEVPDSALTFTPIKIADQANLWWARSLVDIDGDGILEVALISNNGHGGWLGYLKGDASGVLWDSVIVAETSPNGRKFAAGDLEAGDMDLDGDVDLIGVEHPGEWADANAEAVLFWYQQNPDGWTPHNVGTIPSALKDISLEDLDRDGIPEIVTVTYNAETLSVFKKGSGLDYQKAWDLEIYNLHEGMDVGDLDGDGWPDIAANGYWLPNPGNLQGPWELRSIDSLWFNQEEGHWSRNATKVVCEDTDGDGRAEVFITHSERTGYPLAKYSWEAGSWKKEILMDSLSAAHSLQVVDMDLDGEYEVITGVNRNRAIDIVKELGGSEEPTEFPVFILKKSETGWSSQIINSDGVYNLLAGDIEGDGDMDLIRLTSHNEKDMWWIRNDLR